MGSESELGACGRPANGGRESIRNIRLSDIFLSFFTASVFLPSSAPFFIGSKGYRREPGTIMARNREEVDGGVVQKKGNHDYVPLYNVRSTMYNES